MQSQHVDTPEEVNLMKLLGKIQTLEAQKSLLEETVKNRNLLVSNMISSLQPKVGKQFTHANFEYRKQKILEETRKKLLLLAIEEKDIELSSSNEQFNRMKHEYTCTNENPDQLLNKVEKSVESLTHSLNCNMNRKITFHLGRQQPRLKFVKKKTLTKKKRKWTAERKKKNRMNYRNKLKARKKEKIKSMVDKIKQENTVINLSDEEVPDATYIFLSKGLGYVPSQKVDCHDLKYDTTEFIRKLAWKAFFKANPELAGNDPNSDVHRDIKVSGYTYPNFTSPLLDDIRTKLFGWIANHTATSPKSNLSPLELRGKKWLIDKMNDELLFVTKADKGGATLIMNFADVKAAIQKELFDPNKFTKLDRNSDQQLDHVKQEVKSLAIRLAQQKLINDNDKILIAGLNSNNRSKIAPEYRPESPYAYPLFKIHKLSITDLEMKKIPPSRLVHASKFGSLYRMEKWCSPFLTTISRAYCNDEFILDTSDLTDQLNDINTSKLLENENVNLFTLDVAKLYPSIQPELALQAIQEALAADTSTDQNTKNAIEQFIRLSFENSYVGYKGESFKSKIGIPTGGSLSRQIADIFLHWILFVKMTPKLSLIQAIRFWKRFIDDVVGIWRGTRRSFENFVKKLNAETRKFGIDFPINEIQFGKSVHCLEVQIHLVDNNKIEYQGYTKPTDAKRYLHPNSFHPRSVFNSIPFSQLLRTLRNNSKEETKAAELDQCVQQFVNSGYSEEKLLVLKEKAIEKSSEETENNNNNNNNNSNNNNDDVDANETDTLMFPVHFFAGIQELKNLIHSFRDELHHLIGDTRIMFAIKKNSSLGNMFVRNKKLSLPISMSDNQRCNAPGCRQCPLVNENTKVVVNDQVVHVPRHLNCKSKSVIYLWLCKLCGQKEAYFGRTIQESHLRTNCHRGCFNENWEKSALSIHAKEVHQTQFSLDIFTISIVKKVSPQQLRREEFKHIDKYRTIPFGLNRYKV